MKVIDRAEQSHIFSIFQKLVFNYHQSSLNSLYYNRSWINSNIFWRVKWKGECWVDISRFFTARGLCSIRVKLILAAQWLHSRCQEQPLLQHSLSSLLSTQQTAALFRVITLITAFTSTCVVRTSTAIVYTKFTSDDYNYVTANDNFILIVNYVD
jgi:hypothetical protein